jgi:2-alkyl-3-oxoalkanoate reductase
VKILVTGASGFVGGSFLRRFSERSDVELLGVGRRMTGLPNYLQVDLAQKFEIPFTPDVVVHAAARASPWGSARDFHQQNVQATKNIVRYCESHGLPKLIYISSSSVFYRYEHQLGVTEDSPIGPTFVNDYASTKYQGELAVQEYSGSKVVLRPRAVFGPFDTVLFPRILRAAQLGRFPLFTQRGPPATGDLIYIDSLCDYIFKAASSSCRHGHYNLTNAQPVVIQDFILDVFRRLELPMPSRRLGVGTAMTLAAVSEAVYRAFGVRREPPITRFGVSAFAFSKTFNVDRALHDLGAPSVPLAEGVDRFIAWQKPRL